MNLYDFQYLTFGIDLSNDTAMQAVYHTVRGIYDFISAFESIILSFVSRLFGGVNGISKFWALPCR